MKFLAYPRSKPSGVEWLGDVPEHWEVKRLRYLCSIRKGRLPAETFSSPTADSDLPYLSMEFLRGETNLPNFVATAPGLIYAEAGDLLLLWDGSNAGEFLRAKKGVVSSTVARFETRDVERGFLSYACKALEPQIKEQTVGMGIPHVSGDELKSCSLPYPDCVEQQVIAAFLDRETGRVDRLVTKKRELIERLKEKRAALISRTVTCGLPSSAARLPENTALKDSGIPWLGKVPKHWSVLPFRRVTTRVDVGIAEAATHAYTNEGVPLVRSTNIKFETVDTSDLLFIEEEFAGRLQSKALRAGDIVTTRTGVNLGVSAIIPKSLHMAQCFTLLISTLTPECDPRFYNAFINADPGKTHFAMASLGAGQHNISVPILKEMPTVRPPLPEQAAIAAYLDEETAKLDALVGKVALAVERLQEYRTALITAAVTGKIDVRSQKR